MSATVFLYLQEQQKREHEEDMRARLRRSESIEKAAVSESHASMNLQPTAANIRTSSKDPNVPGSL